MTCHNILKLAQNGTFTTILLILLLFLPKKERPLQTT
jgi:hypothetical protein